VDEQNLELPGYVPMVDTQQKRDRISGNPTLASVLEVIDEAVSSPSAYVEPSLFRNRRVVTDSEK